MFYSGTVIDHTWLFFAVSQRESIWEWSMGVWHGWHIPHTSFRLYAACQLQRCSYVTPYHCCSRCSWYRNHSDQWAAYHGVSSLPGIAGHSTVNHSLHFVDSATGTHTQNIESYWNRTKKKLKQMNGCHNHQLPSYLDEFMWRERHTCDSFIGFYKILQHIAEQYPVPWLHPFPMTNCNRYITQLDIILVIETLCR